MTDAKDAIDEARIRIKKAAASMLVRKEKLEEELVRAKAADSPLVPELEEQVDVAEADYQGALTELRELADLAKDFEQEQLRGVVRNASSSDPFSPSAVDRALENVRNHIGELEARVSLDRELQGVAQEPRVQERVDKDAALREQLAALKAKKRSDSAAPEGEPETPPPPKKRTL
jgi:hypothetical protein